MSNAFGRSGMGVVSRSWQITLVSESSPFQHRAVRTSRQPIPYAGLSTFGFWEFAMQNTIVGSKRDVQWWRFVVLTGAMGLASWPAAAQTWVRTDIGLLEPTTQSSASGVNDYGTVVGIYRSGGDTRGFVWTGGSSWTIGAGCQGRFPQQDGRSLRRAKRRWVVERFFAWLHNPRRLVTSPRSRTPR